MNTNAQSNSYGYLTLVGYPNLQLRIKADSAAHEGLDLYTMPISAGNKTGIKTICRGQFRGEFQHVSIDKAGVGYAYRPGTGNYREFLLGPCKISMDSINPSP
jgi:hypothetical protein